MDGFMDQPGECLIQLIFCHRRGGKDGLFCPFAFNIGAGKQRFPDQMIGDPQFCPGPVGKGIFAFFSLSEAGDPVRICQR